MSQYEGFVVKINTKTGTGKRGPWTAYSFRISDKNGQEVDEWFGNGFEPLTTAAGAHVAEGDYVQFETHKDDRGYTRVTENTMKRSKNPPKAPGNVSGGPTGGGGGGGSAQPNIHYQNSRTAAIETVRVLLENDGLPVTGGKNKGDKVKRFDEITGFIDKFTVQFYLDLETPAEDQPFRILASVADGRVADPDEAELPTPEPAAEDDAPPVDSYEDAAVAADDDGDFE